MPVISTCDDPNEWSGRTPNITIEADTVDFVTPPASIRVESIGNEWNLFIAKWYYPGQDWSADPVITLLLKVSDPTRRVYVRVYYDFEGQFLGERYLVTGLIAETWQNISVDLRNAGVDGRTPNLYAIRGFQLIWELNQALGVMRFDQIERVSGLPPPAQYRLSILTPETGEIPCTLDSQLLYSNRGYDLQEGTYTITMPTQVSAVGRIWNFNYWEDTGSTENVRQISLTSPLTLTAHYVPTHNLNINSTPIEGIQFSIVIGGQAMSYVTPWSGSLEEGTYQIEMPSNVQVGSDIYNFVQWEDGSTNPIRTINLVSDMTLTATYELYVPPPPPPTHTLTVGTTPISGVPFQLDGASQSTPYTATLEEKTYTVTMPSNVQVGTDIYNFKSWEDGSTNPLRTINLTVDMSLMATYELYTPPPPAKGNLEIHAFYQGVEVSAQGSVNGIAITSTPVTLELDPKAYTITLTYAGKTQTKTASVLEGQTIRTDVEIAPPPTPISPLKRAVPILAPLGIGTVLYWLSQKK